MKISVLLFFSVFIISTANAEEINNYDDCILKYMQGVTSDLAAKKISRSCAAKYAKNWEDAGTVSKDSRQTANNDNHGYQSGCPAISPDNKYCADRVHLVVHLKDTDEYVYRFKRSKGCPNIRIASGPQGWMKVESCNFSDNGRIFTASIIGWTHPQIFRAILATERKRK